MKMRIAFNNMQLNNVPLEQLIFDSNDIKNDCILVDDINEKRWKITFKVHLAFRMTRMNYVKFNYFKGGDFPDDCFEEKKGFPVLNFVHILWKLKIPNGLKRLESH